MIEHKIIKNLSEATNYEPNQLLANVIGSKITGMGFLYSGFLNEPVSEELGLLMQIDVELNQDDVEVVMSDNVIYCYINSDKIDHKLKPLDHHAHDIENLPTILQNHKFVPRNPKAWRDDSKLYLLKINLNSGIIGRYDINTGRFKNQEVNWNTSTPEEVVDYLLTKTYLYEYLKSELSLMESYVSFLQHENSMERLGSDYDSEN